jgi:hypothetical protein
MPVMTPRRPAQVPKEPFPQAAHFDLKVEHLDDATIRVRLPSHERNLRPGVAHAVTANLNINFMQARASRSFGRGQADEARQDVRHPEQSEGFMAGIMRTFAALRMTMRGILLPQM